MERAKYPDNWNICPLDVNVDTFYDSNVLQKACINAAHYFGRTDSYAAGRDRIKTLYGCMSKCQKLPLYVKHLLSNVIFTCFRMGMEAGNNQWIDVNNNDLFRIVIVSMSIWYIECFSVNPQLDPLHPQFNTDHRNYNAVFMQEEFCIEVSKIIKKFNEFGRRQIHNIAFWTWPRDRTYSLKTFWTNFDVSHSTEEEAKIQFNISLDENRFITHATSALNFIKMLKTLKNSNKSIIELEAPKTLPSSQYVSPGLVWTGVNLTENEINKIPLWFQKHFNGDERNRYGSVILKFPLEKVRKSDTGLILGTRKYLYELSKTILVPPREGMLGEPGNDFGYLFEGRAIHRLEIVKMKNFQFQLDFNYSEWTHPEIAFANNLDIPLEDLTISFESHSCIKAKEKDCRDCNFVWEPVENENGAKKSKLAGIQTVEDAKLCFKQCLDKEQDLKSYFKETFNSSMFSQVGCFEYLTSH